MANYVFSFFVSYFKVCVLLNFFCLIDLWHCNEATVTNLQYLVIGQNVHIFLDIHISGLLLSVVAVLPFLVV